jgi:DNA-directed RNA polymerase specialized sigma24 family protein
VWVAGLDPSDAADVCGVTPQTLRQRLHRARTALAEALEMEARPVEPILREVTP